MSYISEAPGSETRRLALANNVIMHCRCAAQMQIIRSFADSIVRERPVGSQACVAGHFRTMSIVSDMIVTSREAERVIQCVKRAPERIMPRYTVRNVHPNAWGIDWLWRTFLPFVSLQGTMHCVRLRE